MKMLMVSGVTLSPGEEDTCEHVAAIITNVTRLREGRQLLLQPGRGLLQVGHSGADQCFVPLVGWLVGRKRGAAHASCAGT